MLVQGKYFEAVCSQIDPNSQTLTACFPADTGMDEFCFKLDYDMLVLGKALPADLPAACIDACTHANVCWQLTQLCVVKSPRLSRLAHTRGQHGTSVTTWCSCLSELWLSV